MPLFLASSPDFGSVADADRNLREWYASLLGQSMLTPLQARISAAMEGVFGYRGLQLGTVAAAPNLIDGAGIYHTSVMAGQAGDDAQLIAAPDALPIASGRLDLLLLFHTLDFGREPHLILREAERVLADDGHLIVVGFNPIGIWGPMRLLLRWHGKTPWNCGFYSMTRIQDWLALLGLKTIEGSTVFYRPPLQRAKLLQRLRALDRLGRWLPTSGAVYVIKARKMTRPLTPVRAHWKPRRTLVGSGLIRPAGRHGDCV